MIADLLPPVVSACEATGPAHGVRLFPAEEAAIRTASMLRRAEVTVGRALARTALAGLGLPATSIPAGRAGEPRWPAGVTGSITHCAGYRACAVARTADVAALGIDAEPDAALPRGLIESVAGAAERTWIAQQEASIHWDRLLFSAKEATGKLWYPLTGHWPRFGELTVFPAAGGTFEARVAESRFTGRWLARGGLIVTAVTWAR
jgi:enterobactin synthetase component D / holo-[acyl-carrier protein] synthase